MLRFRKQAWAPKTGRVHGACGPLEALLLTPMPPGQAQAPLRRRGARKPANEAANIGRVTHSGNGTCTLRLDFAVTRGSWTRYPRSSDARMRKCMHIGGTHSVHAATM